jgi:hypothetical protein
LDLHYLRGSGRVAEDLDALQALLQHPDAAHIRRVDLHYLQLDPNTLADWLQHSWLAGVTALDLRGHRLTAKALDALADNPAAGRLRTLCVDVGDDVSETLRILTTSRVLGWLDALDLSGSSLADAGVAILANSGALSRLRGLNLRGTGVGPAGVAALLAVDLSLLMRLDLSENPIGDGAAEAFAGANLPALVRLDLGYPRSEETSITDRGAQALAQARLPRLTDLGVEFHAIGDAGALALAALPALRLLRISDGNPITPAGRESLTRVSNPGLDGHIDDPFDT